MALAVGAVGTPGLDELVQVSLPVVVTPPDKLTGPAGLHEPLGAPLSVMVMADAAFGSETVLA